ncbi:hypothetical protein MKY04_16140 [Lysinibacillus telephonicus]|uniref:hypothetical protein n=1 Tax=Lysinibacillus telephonicus TaxID=1714840 RepID=UPI0031FD82DC
MESLGFTETAIFFITSVFLFFLGIHGVPFFKWIYTIISKVNATTFGTICTWLLAIIIIFIQWKFM